MSSEMLAESKVSRWDVLRGRQRVPVVRKQLEVVVLPKPSFIGVCIVKSCAKVAALLLSVAAIQASAQSAPEGQSGAQKTQIRGY
jgi:hypothetical protein